MEIADFLIILLDECNGEIESETRLHKLTFLTEREKQFDFAVQFKWHHYGPYSKDVTNVLTNLDKNGVLTMNEEERVTFMGDAYSIKTFKLTSKGRNRAEIIRNRLSNNTIQSIRAIINQYGMKPLKDILSYVYTSYSSTDL